MNVLKNLSLSLYSFGYGFGFIQDPDHEAKNFQNMTLETLIDIAKKFDLGGIEVPIDKCFPFPDNGDLENLLDKLLDIDKKLIFALENFSDSYISSLVPIIRKYSIPFIRIKVSSFYGGNRFEEDKYKYDLEKFQFELGKVKPILDGIDCKLLIENHQDVTTKDITDLIHEYDASFIGVNWDIGNSYPSGDTVSKFFEKTKDYIGNVHLKDYIITESDLGFKMHRCPLGQGVVDFKETIAKILSQNKDMPLTIELGAWINREAKISNQNFWNYTNGVSKSDIEVFKEEIRNISTKNGQILSEWERRESPEKIASTEKEQVFDSIKFIKEMLQSYEQ